MRKRRSEGSRRSRSEQAPRVVLVAAPAALRKPLCAQQQVEEKDGEDERESEPGESSISTRGEVECRAERSWPVERGIQA
jgi:hypothetical protein